CSGGCHIQQERTILCCGSCEGDGIGAEHRLTSARRHDGRTPDRGCRNAQETLLCDSLRVETGSPIVVGVPDRRGANPEEAGFPGCHPDGLQRNLMAEAATAV